MNFVKTGIIGIVVVYIAACALLYFQQRAFLYFPTPEVSRSDAEAFYLENQGERIKIWRLSTGASKAILYFGGNAEEVTRNIEPFSESLQGYDIYLLNYRGYSGSTGAPSETALLDDAIALYNHVQASYETISIVGRSLGSGVYVASERPVERMALITPYDSIANVAQAKFPIIPVSLLLKDTYDSASRARDVTAATLVFIAEHDRVIPERHAKKLIRKLTHAAVFETTIKDTNHLTVSSPLQFWDEFAAFFRTTQDAPQ